MWLSEGATSFCSQFFKILKCNQQQNEQWATGTPTGFASVVVPAAATVQGATVMPLSVTVWEGWVFMCLYITTRRSKITRNSNQPDMRYHSTIPSAEEIQAQLMSSVKYSWLLLTDKQGDFFYSREFSISEVEAKCGGREAIKVVFIHWYTSYHSQSAMSCSFVPLSQRGGLAACIKGMELGGWSCSSSSIQREVKRENTIPSVDLCSCPNTYFFPPLCILMINVFKCIFFCCAS